VVNFARGGWAAPGAVFDGLDAFFMMKEVMARPDSTLDLCDTDEAAAPNMNRLCLPRTNWRCQYYLENNSSL
jgi:arginine utilization protein RocB